MSFEIPREYTICKFFQYGIDAKYNKFNDSYQCGCPICKEGTSAGKKQRCYYLPANNNIYCHNCGWSSTPINWIIEVSGTSFNNIIDEIKDFNVDVDQYIDFKSKSESVQKFKVADLPDDCINLFDKRQIDFFKDQPVVKSALDLIKRRRLDTAINKPRALYVSLNDKVHKNRIIIPFCENNKAIFYQSRSIGNQEPKYLSKINSSKSLYGFDNIDDSLDHVFLFEGPINSFFVKNGLAVAGIQENSQHSLTSKQIEQLSSLVLFKKIWVLDSQWIDNASKSKSKILADQGETIFIWPEKIGRKYKDFNDLAMKFNLNELSTKFIVDNSYTGMGAKIALEAIR